MVAPNGFNMDGLSNFHSGDRITPEGKEALEREEDKASSRRLQTAKLILNDPKLFALFLKMCPKNL